MSVISADGTTIDYHTVGSGPGIIVIPGALSIADNYRDLAAALSADFTVHTVERRGRGSSGPQGADYEMARECEDLAAVQSATGAHSVFGHSYGGLIALEAARSSRSFTKIVVYEPGVSIGGSVPMAWVTAYERHLAEGKSLDAFIDFALGTGPANAERTPRWLMKLVLAFIVRGDRRRQIFQLLPANLREHEQVAALDGSYENYREIDAEVLWTFGGRSAQSITAIPAQLSSIIPNLTTHGFPKLDHFGPDEKDPAAVAAVIRAFLLAP